MIRKNPNDTGQMTLDFLLGLVIFMIAVLYLVAIIPGIFMPYQNNAVDLSSVVYRTSSLLVEDPGYFITSGNVGVTDWEKKDASGNLSRIGLASSKYAPGIISLKKINALSDNVTYEKSRDKLGLNNTVPYDYSLEITWVDKNGNLNTMTKPNATEPSVPVGTNVESIQRIVMIDEGRGILVNSIEAYNNTTDMLVDKMMFNVTKNQSKDNNVNITILDSTGGNILNLYAYNFHLTANDQFVIYVNDTLSTLPTPVNQHANVRIVINGTKVDAMMGSLETYPIILETSMTCFRMNWNNYTYDESNPRYWSVYDKGVLKLKVWS